MKSAGWLIAAVLAALATSDASAGILMRGESLNAVNRRLSGTIVDHTHNHGADNRIWSQVLCQKRDLYIYLPPGYDPAKKYPAMLWLHGTVQDEQDFLSSFVEPFDRAIACGTLPPMIIAAPDGTRRGRPSAFRNSFYLNSKLGNFEDYLIDEVWAFVVENYPIRPEREAHVLAGISMGGFASFNQSMKHRETFKVAIGFFPSLNLRWVDCHGRYMGNFDPNCWGWREDLSRGREVIGRFYCGLITVRIRMLINPLFGLGPDAVARLSYDNPAEMLDRLQIGPGDLNMCVVYGGKDGFNLDAQIESFLYLAKERGIPVFVGYEPNGRHSSRLALRWLPGVIGWLGGLLEPFREGELPAPK